MAKKSIKVLILVNSLQTITPSGVNLLEKLETFVAKPPTCNLEVISLNTTSSTDALHAIATNAPDLCIHYGFGNGELFSHLEDSFSNITFLYDNHSAAELFYTDQYIYKFFDSIKDTVIAIDSKKNWPSKLQIATSRDDLEYIRHRCFSESFGMDTETNFLNPFVKDPEPKLLCYSIAWPSDEEEGWCIPTSQHLIDSGNCQFSKDESWAIANEIFFESEKPMVIHNAQYDLLVLYELFNGRKPKNFFADTMLLLNLYHHAAKSSALKENTDLINLPAYKDPIKDWINAQPKVKGKKYTFEDVPLSIIGPYAAMDAIAVVRLFNFLKKNMDRSLWEFYYKIPAKVLDLSNELTIKGYRVSQDRVAYSKIKLAKEISTSYSVALCSIPPRHLTPEFNINSGKQLAELLFTKLNLPVLKKTPKGTPATDSKSLDDLILFHPFIFHLVKYKKLSKLYGTYIKGLRGTLNSGSRHKPRYGNFTFNAQYRQLNRTARLGSSNMSGHNDIDKTGGNILTLPAKGSLVKHFLIPDEIVDLENKFYDKLVSLFTEDEKKQLDAALAEPDV